MSQLTVVFDLDGTLVDTAPDLVESLNFVFRRDGVPELPYVEARALIGGGIKPLIERGLAVQGLHCPPDEISQLYADFLAHYTEHIADRSRPFPGLVEALDALDKRDCRLAVCTNKLEGLARRLLDALGLAPRFAAISGPDTYGIYKPDPVILRRTVEAAQGDPCFAVMVGDSETDVATARAAAIPMVAVDFGYPVGPAAELGPDRLISHFAALEGAVEALFPQLAA